MPDFLDKSRGTLRWALVIAALAGVVALLTLARGAAHHRGDELGARAPVSIVVGQPAVESGSA
jgi:hypothetical protein